MKNDPAEKQLLTVKDLAHRWSISPRTIYNEISKKTFPIKPKKIGRLVRFRLTDIEQFEANLK